MKRINGFSNYFITLNGDVISTLKYRNNYHVIKPVVNKKGYYVVKLKSDSGKYCHKKVHRLVGLTFIDNPNKYAQINHINGIKTDNRVENIEWCDNLYNQTHAIKLGLVPAMKGERNGQHILTEIQVKEIRDKFKPRIYTREMLANEYNVKACTIKDVVLRKSWKHI